MSRRSCGGLSATARHAMPTPSSTRTPRTTLIFMGFTFVRRMPLQTCRLDGSSRTCGGSTVLVIGRWQQGSAGNDELGPSGVTAAQVTQPWSVTGGDPTGGGGPRRFAPGASCSGRLHATKGERMPDIRDGESVEVKGSAAKPYVLKNVGGVYSCTCPAWRNQSTALERRTCKHLRRLRGDAAEEARLGGALPQKPVRAKAEGDDGEEGAGPPLLLAESWDNATDLSGWWMSEKLD